MAGSQVTRVLHPRHGIHAPVTGTPERAPGSVRRTATMDMLRPAGLLGPLLLTGLARDLATRPDGAGTVLAESGCTARIDFIGGRVLTEIRPTPNRPALQALLGLRVSSGFRSAVTAADPRLSAEDGLLNLLLDDFPVATLVSGHAVGAGLSGPQRAALSLSGTGAGSTGRPQPGLPGFQRDLCAGFADGGTIMNDVDATGRPPLVTGPAAPPLATADRLGWHKTGVLPPHAMRRSRRMDITPGQLASVDVLYRDSHVDADSTETIVHEYTISATVDTAHGVFVTCSATPRVLPWVECPAAALSASRLVGQPVTGLRGHVRDTFLGTSTCTHLNDTLRSLEDIPALLKLASR